jgi:hypothetical protein
LLLLPANAKWKREWKLLTRGLAVVQVETFFFVAPCPSGLLVLSFAIRVSQIRPLRRLASSTVRLQRVPSAPPDSRRPDRIGAETRTQPDERDTRTS